MFTLPPNLKEILSYILKICRHAWTDGQPENIIPPVPKILCSNVTLTETLDPPTADL